MRTIRLRQVLVLAGAVLGLLATAAPSAQATTAGSITFQGGATLSAGLSYPCILGPTVLVDKCPTVVYDTTAPPGKTVTVTGGHTRGFSFFSSVCVAAGTTVLTTGAGEVSAAAGLCNITAAGTVTGSCGLSSGLGTFVQTETKTGVLLTVNPPSSKIFTLTTTRTGPFHFIGVGGTLVVTGSTSTGGTLAGVVEAIPPPDPTLPPGTPGIGNSCVQKTATEFTIAGEVAFVE